MECSEEAEDVFCNGPLKDDTVYHVKLRAYNELGQSKDTVYSDPIKTG